MIELAAPSAWSVMSDPVHAPWQQEAGDFVID